MKSVIYRSDLMPNLSREFGEGLVYFPCIVVDLSLEERVALLTENQLRVAIARGSENPQEADKVTRLRDDELRQAIRAKIVAVAAAFVAGLSVGAMVL